MKNDGQSDSGVSEDLPSDARLPPETPIEREIRRAIEREKSLRRSRGLPNPRAAPEYVEVPSRRSLPGRAKWSQSRDREFAGKKMQHEIREETLREQDLVRSGKVRGVYDRGSPRQLRERKQLFEPPQAAEPRKQPWSSSSSEDSALGLQEEEEVTPVAPRGPGLSDATGRQVIVLEHSTKVPGEAPHEAPRHEGLLENPFFKLRSSASLARVRREILEAEAREQELRSRRGGPGAPAREDTSPVQRPWELKSGFSAERRAPGKLSAWRPGQAEDQGPDRTEALQRPLSGRQKTPLVQLWESGMIHGNKPDQDSV